MHTTAEVIRLSIEAAYRRGFQAGSDAMRKSFAEAVANAGPSCVWFTWDDKSQALVPFKPTNGKDPAGCDPGEVFK